jgi:hypothetical protein
MARLYGAQRMVLHALLDVAGQSDRFVEDSSIAHATTIALGDVRNWLLTLEDDEYINLARTEAGYSASITAKGRLAIGLFLPTAASQPAARRASNTPAPSSVSPGPRARTILVVAANPRGTERLRLDEEVKKIEQGLERARNRDQFAVVAKWAVTDDDLRRALLDHEPAIVHFSGHGSSGHPPGHGRELGHTANDDQGGLAFEDESGEVKVISGEALARLFELCADFVECVLLSACYSEAQADAIARHIEHVIGMSKAIGDQAAIKFAVGFYDALGAGRDYKKAFQFGCSAIDLSGIPEHLTPVLKLKGT